MSTEEEVLRLVIPGLDQTLANTSEHCYQQCCNVILEQKKLSSLEKTTPTALHANLISNAAHSCYQYF